jgi:hypothetical protein
MPFGEWEVNLEPWSGAAATVYSTDSSQVVLRGNQRGYLATRGRSRSLVQYEMLHLLGKTLRYTVDLSQVGCSCNVALYLVAMPQPNADSSRYCDIQGGDPHPCVEIDLLEGNTKAIATTLHTTPSMARNDCNKWGCQTRYGATDNNCKFGAGSPNIDSLRPFEMAARFDSDGSMSVDAGQRGAWRRLWDRRIAHAPQRSIESLRRTLADGVVLVVSLWAANDMSWLDGGCTREYPRCALRHATAVFSNLRIEDNGAPSSPPPFPPSAPTPPLRPPQCPPSPLVFPIPSPSTPPTIPASTMADTSSDIISNEDIGVGMEQSHSTNPYETPPSSSPLALPMGFGVGFLCALMLLARSEWLRGTVSSLCVRRGRRQVDAHSGAKHPSTNEQMHAAASRLQLGWKRRSAAYGKLADDKIGGPVSSVRAGIELSEG